MTMTWLSAVDTIRTARNQAAGKPLANNTRLFVKGEGDEREFHIKYHNTFIVVIHSDDTYTLSNGGYNTSTTLERIRDYTPCGWQQLQTEKGDWYVGMKPVDRDPRPERIERSIPRPFTAEDPGDEPVKDMEGCKAGQVETTNHVKEPVEIYRHALLKYDVIEEVVGKGYSEDGKYDRVIVKRSWNSHVYYSEDRYYDEGWANLADNHNVHGDRFRNDDGEVVKRVQCPHCAEFDAIHERWKYAYEGGVRYGSKSIDQHKGYKTYVEMMGRFGTVEAWQEAYIEDFRARKAYLKADREWVQRNRVPFYDGIKVDGEGWAPRVRQEGPSPAKLRRHEKEVERMRKRIDKYIEGYVKALEAGKVAMPGNGDCWFCLLHTSEGKSFGDLGDNSHLDSHMKERYYVPTLAVNALRERGNTDIGIYIILGMDHDNNTMGMRAPMTDKIRRDMRLYLRKRLIPQAPTA